MARVPPLARAGAVLLLSVGAGLGLGWLVGVDAVQYGPLPLTAALVGVAFLIQWLAFVPAWLQRTERFYDLTGSLTYLSVVGLALVLTARVRPPGPRELLVAAMVAVWAVRLGSFLVRRIRRDGKDGRFDEIKQSAPRFLVAWTLQGLWVSLTALAALTLLTDADPAASLGLVDALGAAIWAAGFAIEVVADAQKRAFKAREGTEGRFIDEGLWSWSRHPNYFGEIVLWLGIFVIGASRFEGTQWLAAVSPVFVYLLLTRISGLPMLEARADARWGGQPDYQAYKARTPELLLKPPWIG